MRISLIMVFAMFGIFLTFAVYGVITFDLSIQEMKKLLGTRNEVFAFNMMQDLDKNIDKRFTDFKELTKEPVVQKAVKESNLESRKLAQIEMFFDTNGTTSENAEKLEPFIQGVTDKELTEDLINIIEFYNNEYGYDVVEELYITNEFGANVGLGSGTSEFRQDNEQWWQTVKHDGQFMGDLTYRGEFGNYATELGFRIDDEDGNFIGVLKVILTLDDMIHEFINDAEIISLPNRSGMLLDNQGRIIYFQGIQNLTGSHPVPYFDNLKDEKEVGTIQLTNENDEIKIISFAKSTGYKSFPGFDWIAVVDQSSSSFIEEFVDLRNSILVTSLIGMLSSIVIGIIVAFFITTPLKELSRLAESISKGNFSVKAHKSKINEIKVIEESFNEMSDSLQKLIETEKKLAESQARVKNERLAGIGEIAASMAHNIKNPLGTIRSSAEIIKRNSKGDSKEIDEVITRMNRAIDRMSLQIEDVLNFVRITPLIENLVSTKTLLNSAVESIDIPKKIKVELPDTELYLKCDPKKIEIVLINIILNAIQSIGDKEGTIKIKTREENGHVIIEIEDSGPGIPEQIFPKIFGPLVTTKEKGTGLGLSTCKNIIEQHGGTISVKNYPTTFIIKIPLK
ncbi:MAG TPA: sensor histidine kinase [Nitrosopumilaceae archaeon]|nr:sensor histidine kinase [Nitrosopumilaceae archaeon]